MFSVHVISDLDYEFNEPSSEEDLTVPDGTDLVIINNHKGYQKRRWLYNYTIAKKYPNIPFVANDTPLLLFNKEKSKNESLDAMRTRMNNDVNWPKNLHYKDPRDPKGMLITLNSGQVVSVFTAFGFSKIHRWEGKWEDTHWGKLISSMEYNDILAKGVSYYTVEEINALFEQEEKMIRDWELSLNNYGILVTHLSPYKSKLNEGCTTSPYLVHLDKKLWVTSGLPINNVKFLGAKLYSNPGRGKEARSKLIYVD